MKYDIMFFEALGAENSHLREELIIAESGSRIPKHLNYYIGTETLQDYLKEHTVEELPEILSAKTHSVFPEEWILRGGTKKSIITRSAGYDHVEHLQGRANVTSLRRYCVNAVAETALKLVLAVCGELNSYQLNSKLFERNSCPSFKEFSGLKATVFGAGNIGRKIYGLLEGCGAVAYAVDIRCDELNEIYENKVKFISPEHALDSDIIVCAMNYTPSPLSRFYNRNYFSRDFLEKCKSGLVFVNVTRGEITDEQALLDLYKSGHIYGIGLDTFSNEEALLKMLRGSPDSSASEPVRNAQKTLIDLAVSRRGNIYTQPHQAFNSDKASLEKARETIRHLEAYYRNGCLGFDSQLPYYC